MLLLAPKFFKIFFPLPYRKGAGAGCGGCGLPLFATLRYKVAPVNTGIKPLFATCHFIKKFYRVMYII